MAKTSLKTIADSLVAKAVKTPKALQSEEAQAEAFGTVKSEAGRRSGVNGGEPDWPLVDKLSIDYLAKVSKDLRVATYLACAWSNQHGPDGMVAGAHMLESFLTTDKFPLEPQRVRGRQAALKWWAGQMTGAQLDGTGGSHEKKIAQFVSTVESMRAHLADNPKLAGKVDIFSDLLEAASRSPAETDEVANDTGGEDVSASEPGQAESIADTEPDVDAKDQDIDIEQSEDAPEEAVQDTVLEAWLADLLQPIKGDSEVGEDLYLSDEFERLKQQISDTIRHHP